jgi:hypothetical protein
MLKATFGNSCCAKVMPQVIAAKAIVRNTFIGKNLLYFERGWLFQSVSLYAISELSSLRLQKSNRLSFLGVLRVGARKPLAV